ncbi:protein of unknown function [Candidatus Nitrosotalea okcheonensis]|uniref:Uncharacterized protein n=1 Tax=Candidatus Nitrosotalea okcheonensis TaxID=1903276 RepID=A0A2H1FCC2_9ARCH|nr:protein of unknown function [Candidatus Nitrosotalea okcheonensis]
MYVILWKNITRSMATILYRELITPKHLSERENVLFCTSPVSFDTTRDEFANA